MLSEKIVVIDDEEKVRKSLTLALVEYEIIGFDNGEKALNYLRRPNEVNLVLLDVMMPGLDGISVLHEIKKVNREISVIIMTAYSSQEMAIQALRNHADDYVEKPFSMYELREKIRTLLKENSSIQKLDHDKDQKVERIKRFIVRNYSNTSLEHIASELCLSAKYVSRMFNERSGTNFREYKINVKMDKAKELLKDSRYTINEISNRLGYMNPESFMRIFKRKIKLTPSQFRLKHERKR